jgi:hypothetical protein
LIGLGVILGITIVAGLTRNPYLIGLTFFIYGVIAVMWLDMRFFHRGSVAPLHDFTKKHAHCDPVAFYCGECHEVEVKDNFFPRRYWYKAEKKMREAGQ